jgi:hypothetical protein
MDKKEADKIHVKYFPFLAYFNLYWGKGNINKSKPNGNYIKEFTVLTKHQTKLFSVLTEFHWSSKVILVIYIKRPETSLCLVKVDFIYLLPLSCLINKC